MNHGSIGWGVRFGRLLILCAGLVCTCWLGIDGAKAQSAFRVADIEVDATASDATIARDTAIRQGMQSAFATLYSRLTLPDAAASRPTLTASALESMIAGFDVDDERVTATRYRATVAYSFDPAAVSRTLTNAGVAFSAQESQPVLILPVYRQGATATLWDDPNPWRTVWQSSPPASGLVPVIVPFGDIEDVRDIDVQGAIDGNRDGLATVASRYGAGSVVVALATAQSQGNVAVTLLRHDLFGQTTREAVPMSSSASFANAVLAVTNALEQDWKQKTSFIPGVILSLRTSVMLDSGLDDWLTVNRAMSTVPLVESVVLEQLNIAEAVLRVNHRGSVDQLTRVLSGRGLKLVPDSAASDLSAPAYRLTLP